MDFSLALKQMSVLTVEPRSATKSNLLPSFIDETIDLSSFKQAQILKDVPSFHPPHHFPSIFPVFRSPYYFCPQAYPEAWPSDKGFM